MTKIFNAMPRSSLANAIALFDFEQEPLDLRAWFYATLTFYEKHGLVPTIMGVGGITGRKYIMVKNGIKKLEACNFENLSYFWIAATPAEDKNNSFKSIMEVSLKVKLLENENRKIFSLNFDHQLIPFQYGSILEVFKEFYSFFKPRYGYGIQRMFSQSPGIYASGGIMGLNSYHIKDPIRIQEIEREREKITKWSHFYSMPDGRYKTGDLRDIYPYNLLCSEHLERKVHGLSLKEWITLNKYGSLVAFEENRWIWHVPEDQISEIQNALTPTGIILCT